MNGYSGDEVCQHCTDLSHGTVNDPNHEFSIAAYEYNKHGNMITYIDPLGAKDEYAYNDEGQIIYKRPRNGKGYKYIYNPKGLLARGRHNFRKHHITSYLMRTPNLRYIVQNPGTLQIYDIKSKQIKSFEEFDFVDFYKNDIIISDHNTFLVFIMETEKTIPFHVTSKYNREFDKFTNDGRIIKVRDGKYSIMDLDGKNETYLGNYFVWRYCLA